MLLLCAESSEAPLGFAVFADGGCFLIAEVAEVGLENSINIISAYLPVTSGFKQIKTFIGIMCRCKTQLTVEARADHMHLDCSPRCQPSVPLPLAGLCHPSARWALCCHGQGQVFLPSEQPGPASA